MNLKAYLYRTRVSGPPSVSNRLRSAVSERTQAERRNTHRFPLALPIEVSVDRSSKSEPIKGRTRDVSANGIYLVANKNFIVGQLIYIRMNLPREKVGGGDSVSLTVGCQVQRVEEMFQGSVKVFGIAVAHCKIDVSKGIFYEWPRNSTSNTETMAVRVKKMNTATWKVVRELIFYCSMGALCGGAIGFLMYLQLGPFKTAEDAGFAAGIFVKSGIQLGFVVWVLNAAILALRHWIFDSQKKPLGVRARFF